MNSYNKTKEQENIMQLALHQTYDIDYMGQEKNENEDSPALKTESMNTYNDSIWLVWFGLVWF